MGLATEGKIMGRERKTVSLESKDTKVLVYLCPICGRRFEAHIHDVVYERKLLFCANEGAVMNCSLEALTLKGKR